MFKTSLVKAAVCRIALKDFSNAVDDLQLALSLSRKQTSTLADHRQLAEILNNLGCLAFITGDAEKARQHFGEALDLLSVASDNSIYVGSKFSSHTATLNSSIIKANVAFLLLSSRDAKQSIHLFEVASEVRCLASDFLMTFQYRL
jgi:tetratricopeptide (TPR) repeat protein